MVLLVPELLEPISIRSHIPYVVVCILLTLLPWWTLTDAHVWETPHWQSPALYPKKSTQTLALNP